MRVKVNKKIILLAAMIVLACFYGFRAYPRSIHAFIDLDNIESMGILYRNYNAKSSDEKQYIINDRHEIEKVIEILNRYQYSKKLIQPDSVKSYAGDSVFIDIHFWGAEKVKKCSLVYAYGAAQEVNLSEKHSAQYHVGFFNKDADALFQEIYSYTRSLPSKTSLKNNFSEMIFAIDSNCT